LPIMRTGILLYSTVPWIEYLLLVDHIGIKQAVSVER